MMDGFEHLEFDNESLHHLHSSIKSYGEGLWTYIHQFFMLVWQGNVAYGQAKSKPYVYMYILNGYESLQQIFQHIMDWMSELHGQLMVSFPVLQALKPAYWFYGVGTVVAYFGLVVFTMSLLTRKGTKAKTIDDTRHSDRSETRHSDRSETRHSDRSETIQQARLDIDNCATIPGGLGIFDLAKTAFKPGHTEAVIKLMEKLKVDVNCGLPDSGLTLFLCACISGERTLVEYMLKNSGADVTIHTEAGDSPLYLATFAIVMIEKDGFDLLEDLIEAGCDVNAQNSSGYTCLHRAASKGNIPLIKFLLSKGADPSIPNNAGIYPIDSAISGAHFDAADLLKVEPNTDNDLGTGEPHTPKFGVLTPDKKHLIESMRPKRKISLRK